MRPAFRILANGTDLGGKLASRVKQIRVTDGAGFESDTVEIDLADHDDADPIALPPTGAELDVFLGYDTTGLQHVGLFVVDELEPGGWPAYLTIRGRASPYEGSKGGKLALQTQKTRAWPKNTKLGDMVAKIAKEHGLQATVASEFKALALPQFDQTDESDISFLVRVARKYDAVVKTGGGTLVLAKRGTGTTASGATLAPVTVTPKGTTRWHMSISRREADGTVVAFWHDHKGGKRMPVQAGSGDPVRRLRHPYPDEASALHAAQGELDKRGRKRNKLSITMPGNPLLTAEGPLVLQGFRAGIPADWVVTQVVHTFAPGVGFSSEVDAELPKGNEGA